MRGLLNAIVDPPSLAAACSVPKKREARLQARMRCVICADGSEN